MDNLTTWDSLSSVKRQILRLSDEQVTEILHLAEEAASAKKEKKKDRFVLPEQAANRLKSMNRHRLDSDGAKWAEYAAALSRASDFQGISDELDEQVLYRRLKEKARKHMLSEELILQVLPAVMAYFRGEPVKPMIFVGPPGCGKTKAGEILAEIFGLPFVLISSPRTEMGHGYQGEADVFKGADIGEFARAMIRNDSICNLFLIDELDKAASVLDNRVRQQDELLNIVQDGVINDNFLNFSIPLAHSVIIVAVNDLDSLDAPFKDRCTIVVFREVELERMEKIVAEYADDVLKRSYRDRVTFEREDLTGVMKNLYERGVTSIRRHKALVDATFRSAYGRYLEQDGRAPVRTTARDFAEEAEKVLTQIGKKSFGFR